MSLRKGFFHCDPDVLCLPWVHWSQGAHLRSELPQVVWCRELELRPRILCERGPEGFNCRQLRVGSNQFPNETHNLIPRRIVGEASHYSHRAECFRWQLPRRPSSISVRGLSGVLLSRCVPCRGSVRSFGSMLSVSSPIVIFLLTSF